MYYCWTRKCVLTLESDVLSKNISFHLRIKDFFQLTRYVWVQILSFWKTNVFMDLRCIWSVYIVQHRGIYLRSLLTTLEKHWKVLKISEKIWTSKGLFETSMGPCVVCICKALKPVYTGGRRPPEACEPFDPTCIYDGIFPSVSKCSHIINVIKVWWKLGWGKWRHRQCVNFSPVCDRIFPICLPTFTK